MSRIPLFGKPLGRNPVRAAFVLLLFLSLATDAPAAPGKIVVADDKDYPPYFFLDAAGAPKGILVDIWTLWSETTGIPVEFSLQEWSAALSAVKTGRADAVGGVARTPRREEMFDLTSRITEIPSAIFFHSQLGGIKSLKDLAGFSVGIVSGDAARDEVLSRHPELRFALFPGTREVVAAAVSGEIKVFIADAPVALHHLARLEGGAAFRQASELVSLYGLHAAVRKGDAQTLALLEDGFSRISDDQIQAILDDWSGRPVHAAMPWSLVASGFAALGLLLLGVFLWNFALRRRVREKTAALEASVREVRESEERFAKAFHSSPAPLVISDIATGRFVDVNARWVEMLGHDKQEQIGRTSREVGIWADPCQRDKAVEILRARGSFKEFPIEFLTKTGEVRPALWSAEIITLQGREVMLSLILDDTERKRAEDALRASEKLYRSVIDNIHDVFYRTDAQGRLSMISPSGVRLLGYESAQEMLGRPNEDFWFDPSGRGDFLERIQKDGLVADFEVVLKRRDGEPVLVATSSGFYRDGDGAVLGVEGIFRDITERKRTEERLRQSEEKFSRLFKLSPDAISLSDPETGMLVEVNEAYARLTGYEESELVGRSSLEIGLFVDPRARRQVVDRLKAEGQVNNMEVEFRRRDGAHVQCSVSCQFITIGRERFLLAVMRDVTEFRRMQEMMIQSEKMVSVGGIAAGIAHEINNPLGIIVQTAQTLVQRTRPDFPKNIEVAESIGLDMALLEKYMQARKILPFVQDMQAAAVRAADIIRHMLDFSRRSESRRAVCSLPAVMDRALALAGNDYDLKRSFDFKRIDIVKDYAEPLACTECTETELEQVFLNLLRNAAQALSLGTSADGSPRIVIRLSNSPLGVRCEVEDNGPGMSEEVRRRVFEPFYTTKPPGIGTGLGLSVSYFIVTRGHGGKMWVESAPGIGTRFVVELPGLSTADQTGPQDAPR